MQIEIELCESRDWLGKAIIDWVDPNQDQAPCDVGSETAQAAAPEPDSAGKYRDYIEVAATPGKVTYITRGGIETAVNTGKRRYREIIVELKD